MPMFQASAWRCAMTNGGLDNVIAAETVLSDVDGEGGRLILRGIEIDDLAGRVSFEAELALLWTAVVAPTMDEGALMEALGRAREAACVRFAPLAAHLAGLST